MWEWLVNLHHSVLLAKIGWSLAAVVVVLKVVVTVLENREGGSDGS